MCVCIFLYLHLPESIYTLINIYIYTCVCIYIAWCRPQNDGPGLRATTLMIFAQHLLGEIYIYIYIIYMRIYRERDVYMYIYIYVCMCVYDITYMFDITYIDILYAYIYIYIYICTYIHDISSDGRVRLCAQVPVDRRLQRQPARGSHQGETQIQAYIHIYTYICIFIYMYVYVCIVRFGLCGVRL
jgi:hypothetical protein